MEVWIVSVLSGFFGAAFTLIGKILYNRLNRPTPNYDFDFEKEVSYQSTVRTSDTIFIPITEFLTNYIRIENYGDDPLYNVSTRIWFNNRKERRYYQTMELAESLFDWEVEQLSAHSHLYALHENIPLLTKGAEEVYEQKTKQGFFIPDKAMEKLKRLSPIKVKVEYEWEDKSYSDIWLVDFSDENEVRFNLRALTFWQKAIHFLKRIFL